MKVLRILVAEDSRGYTEFYQEEFGDTPHEVTYVKNGLLLLEALTEDSTFDLVITDNQMPGLSGLAVLQEMREVMGLVNLPVIVFSSSSRLASVFEELGAAFVDKSDGISAVFEAAKARFDINIQ